MDDIIRIRGGKRLNGEVTISSCKNSVVAILPSVVLASEVVKLYDVPDIQDVKILIKLLELLNISVRVSWERCWEDSVMCACIPPAAATSGPGQ